MLRRHVLPATFRVNLATQIRLKPRRLKGLATRSVVTCKNPYRNIFVLGTRGLWKTPFPTGLPAALTERKTRVLWLQTEAALTSANGDQISPDPYAPIWSSAWVSLPDRTTSQVSSLSHPSSRNVGFHIPRARTARPRNTCLLHALLHPKLSLS